MSTEERQIRWDKDYLSLAKHWAERKSKDPNKKVGAVVVSKNNNIVGMGYNGFPKGVYDTPSRYTNRKTKLDFVVHAEINAILDAKQFTQDATLYVWPSFTCKECAKVVIQSGISRVVSFKNIKSTWEESIKIAREMYYEAGVIYKYYNLEEIE